jgi:hypothetical protein
LFWTRTSPSRLLETALSGRALFVVTGDEDLKQPIDDAARLAMRGIIVISPALFLPLCQAVPPHPLLRLPEDVDIEL